MPIDKLFGNLVESPSAKGALSGAASGALVSMLMHPKSRKKLGKTAVKVGGAAALAGVGYMAYKKWQSSKAVATAAPSQAGGFAPAEEPQSIESAASSLDVPESLGFKLVLAMIGAAAADGTVDNCEMDTLLDAIDAAALSADENSKLTAALNAPPPLEEIAALPSNEEEASELYGASLAAIDLDSPAEHLYLRRLARALSLDKRLVEEIHAAAKEE